MAPITQLWASHLYISHMETTALVHVSILGVLCDTWQGGRQAISTLATSWKLGLKDTHDVWALLWTVVQGTPGLGHYLWDPNVRSEWRQTAQMVDKVSFGVKPQDGLQQPFLRAVDLVAGGREPIHSPGSAMTIHCWSENGHHWSDTLPQHNPRPITTWH